MTILLSLKSERSDRLGFESFCCAVTSQPIKAVQIPSQDHILESMVDDPIQLFERDWEDNC
jgi:hypothetical protein